MALRSRIKAHLVAADISQNELCRRIGLDRSSIYRRQRRAPWKGAHHNEDTFFTRLSEQLGDSKGKLLWLAGYNPFVERDLTLRQMDLIFEIVAKLVHEVKGGTFDGDLGKLSTIAAEDLAGLKRQTTKVPGDKRPPQEVLDAVARGELTPVGEDGEDGDHGDLG